MSKDLKYKQAANVERRTWDAEEYEAKAKARAASGEGNKGPMRQPVVGEKRKEIEEEFLPAVSGAAGPERSKRAFLKARKGKVDIDSKVGSSEIVSAESVATTKTGDITDGVTKTGVGWHCKVCDCFLKDSHTYLDHINGRKHQRSLGYSMRVERSTKDQVQDRLQALLKKNETDNMKKVAELTPAEALKAKDEEEQKLKEEKRRRKREARKKKVEQAQEENEEEEEEPQIDPALAAMMGFGGFGGGNKNR